MGRPVKNIAGLKFHRLAVVEFSHINHAGRAYWKCMCDCGVEVVVSGRDLRGGGQQSCGCLRKENMSGLTHGMFGTRIYKTWISMLTRCRNPNTHSFADYGGRGITVSSEWLSFDAFYRDMGEQPFPSAQLDRIDNNKGYSKENCRWATPKQNSRNKRSSRFIEVNGEQVVIAELIEKCGFKNRNTIYNRLKAGWSIKKTLSTPVRAWGVQSV